MANNAEPPDGLMFTLKECNSCHGRRVDNPEVISEFRHVLRKGKHPVRVAALATIAQREAARSFYLELKDRFQDGESLLEREAALRGLATLVPDPQAASLIAEGLAWNFDEGMGPTVRCVSCREMA